MAMHNGSEGGYRWSFTRIGGVDQVVLRNGEDILHIPELDRKLWAALAMPCKGAGLLPDTVARLDADSDGRIRDCDIVSAIEFAGTNLASLDSFLEPGENLVLSALKRRELKEAASILLGLAERPDAGELKPGDLSLAVERFAGRPFNGDGVVPPSSAPTPELAGAIAEIAAAGYGLADSSGAAGLDAPGLERFITDARACLDWVGRGTAADILPLGDATPAAWKALDKVAEKIDDWFLRSRLSALSAAADSGQAEKYGKAFAESMLRADSEALLNLPLAMPDPAQRLDISGPLNPAWESAIAELANRAGPLLGLEGDALGLRAWTAAKAALAPHGRWLESAPVCPAMSLPRERLPSLLDAATGPEIPALIAEDCKAAALRDHILELRALMALRRDLIRVLRNFVNFSDFYVRRDGIFQSGRLFLDGRECELCLDVENAGSHAALAGLSGAYLAYCECSRKDGSARSIVAAFTAGDADRLFPGRNGIFYDRDGKDWDARIARVIVQPISIREAFFSPYKWLARSVEAAVQKRASSAESGVQGQLKSKADTVVGAAAGAKVEAGKLDPPKKMDVGTVAAIGVALGSIGAMVTGILGTFLGMGIWMPIGFASVFLLISGPSMILAYMKLRRRNIGPLLDAQGWAINGLLKINVPFGGTLTHLAALPPGAERLLQDPFGEKKRPWKLYIALVLIAALGLAWAFGLFDAILPAAARFRTLIGQ